MKKLFFIFFSFVTLILLNARHCSAKRKNKGHNIQTIAVMPFENLSNVPQAAEEFRDILINKISTSDTFRLVNDQEIENILLRLRVRNIGYISTNKAIEIGNTVSADAILMGSILYYSVGANPQISVRIQLIKINRNNTTRVLKDIIESRIGTDSQSFLELGKLSKKEILITVANQIHEKL